MQPQHVVANAASSNIGRVIGVSTNVGATALTAIRGAHSTASAFTSPFTACLLAQYAERPGYPTSPICEETATIRAMLSVWETARANARHAR